MHAAPVIIQQRQKTKRTKQNKNNEEYRKTAKYGKSPSTGRNSSPRAGEEEMDSTPRLVSRIIIYSKRGIIT